ncbi:hypothetical protein C7N43_01110 [Sphingobacteriales bacterium UPWRP_1]|nr:hypothetical protein B6N25_14490 [Sphingobacteriales bacterium TSM_CSS]PSJ78911.1 hypothetical protein C7N43_01110 [Sphingobacteriales bacterium UPWRP_1]
MKRAVFMFLLLFAASYMYAQDGTTWEEYNYIKKGIAVQAANGLDIEKKGYKVESYTSFKAGPFSVTFDYLRRTSTKKIAATIIGVSGSTYKKPALLCMPNLTAAGDVQAQCFKDIAVYFRGSEEYMMEVLMRLYAYRTYYD